MLGHQMTIVADIKSPNHLRPATTDPRGQSPLFYISISKMIIMNFATLGLFQVYWMYKQWIAIKYYEGRHIRPMWRVIFGIIWIFPLAVKMTRICSVHGLRKPLVPLLFFALALFVFTVISLSPSEGGALIGSIAVGGTLIPFQLTANRVAKHAMPDIASPRYSDLDKTALGFGVLFLALSMSGLFLELPDQ
jgi:hypothetical protein